MDQNILYYLTNYKGKDACNDFIRRILIPNYELDIDYKQVSVNKKL